MKELTYNEFTSSYKTSKNKKILLDVRTPDEAAGGKILEATLIPLQELDTRYDELSKNSEIYIHCRSGKRAQAAAALLEKNGFSQVFVAIDCGYEQLKSHF